MVVILGQKWWVMQCNMQIHKVIPFKKNGEEV